MDYSKFKTAHNETHEMTIHSKMPWISGIAPTLLRVVRERLAPIRNSVTIIPALARPTSESKMLGSTMVGAYDRTAVASRKRKLNQGTAILARSPPSFLR